MKEKLSYARLKIVPNSDGTCNIIEVCSYGHGEYIIGICSSDPAEILPPPCESKFRSCAKFIIVTGSSIFRRAHVLSFFSPRANKGIAESTSWGNELMLFEKLNKNEFEVITIENGKYDQGYYCRKYRKGNLKKQIEVLRKLANNS